MANVETITEDVLIKAKKAHKDFLDVIQKPINEEDIIQRKQLISEKGHNEHLAWDNYVEVVRKTLPNGQITKEQVKSAIILLMKGYTIQGFDLTEIISLFESNVIQLN